MQTTFTTDQLKDPGIAQQLAAIGAEPVGSTPAELDTFRRA